MASIYQQLREAEDAVSDSKNLIDLLLILRRQKTGETLLAAGGQWDRLARRFTDADPTDCRIIDLEESQVEFTRWFATWLHDFREGYQRDTSLVLAGGERRGGKTFDLQMCTLAACIDVPSSIGWLVCNTYRERDEVQELIKRFVPAHWYKERKAPDFRFDLVNGSTLRYQSAKEADSLKQGRADIVFLNEAQKMSVAALGNSLGGTIDNGGIALLAANPPRMARGEWVLELKDAIDEERVIGCRFFGFDSTLNTRIDQGARSRFRSIIGAVDPRAAEADAEGQWAAVGDVAYRGFKRKLNVKLLPDAGANGRLFGDITARLIDDKCGLEHRDFANGADFQQTPHHAGVSVKAFAGADGLPIYYAVGEIVREGTEDDFLDTVEEATDDGSRIWSPDNTVWVGDASGAWQDGAHRVRGRVSFDIFRERRWAIYPPTKKKTDKGDFPRNPARQDRLNLVNRLCAEQRFFIAGYIDGEGVLRSRCPQLELALRKCQLKNGRPVGIHAHITDALGYVLWWLEPRRNRPSVTPSDIRVVPLKRRDR